MLSAGTLIAADDAWSLWTLLIGVAALSIVLEQKNRFARVLTGPVLALFGGMFLSNFGVVPTDAPTYDVVQNYVIPLAIPLLLMRMNLLRVIRETGRLFVVFHLSTLGTIVGGFVAVWLLHDGIAHLVRIGPAMIASYIGGSINFYAVNAMFNPPEDLVGATVVADNAVMALYFLVLIALPGIAFVRRFFPETERSRGFREAGPEGGAEAYWKPKPIALLDIAIVVAIAFAITAVAVKTAAYFAGPDFSPLVREVLGQKYLILTTLSILFPLLAPKVADRLAGSDELGTFCIYIFFVMMGVPASFHEVLVKTPLLFVFCGVILLFNFMVTFGVGKLLGYELEEMILCAVVSSGGPMNGAAISISKGWSKLVFPSVLAGIWGYVIGNYVGYASGKVLQWIFGS